MYHSLNERALESSETTAASTPDCTTMHTAAPSRKTPNPLLAALLPVLWVGPMASSAQTSGDAKAPPEVAALIQEFCVECHGSDKAKAGLDLKHLKFDLSDPRAFTTWVRVHDKMAAGEMPPSDEAQPLPDKRHEVLRSLDRAMRAASLEQQKKEGRVPLRRLNRTQHEHTLNDLLGVSVQMATVLPEDASRSGFDNVSEALDVSSTHLLLYQNAAEVALDAAIVFRPPPALNFRATGQELVDRGFSKLLDKGVRFDGKRLTVHIQLPNPIPLQTTYVPATGRYRLKFVAQALNTGNRPLPLEVRVLPNRFSPTGKTLVTWDLPADQPGVFETETVLRKSDVLRLNAWQLPNEYTIRKPVTGAEPGYLVELLELEGPLDEFPSKGHQRLFGNLPLKPASVARAEQAGWRPPEIPNNRNDEGWRRDPLIPVSVDPRADGERLLRSFLPLAMRRPADEAALAYHLAFFQAELDRKQPFHVALRNTYKAILSAPGFFYFKEQPGPLDAYAVASRLSYFLWSSLPDEELLAVASRDELRQPAVLRAQVERMLKDNRSQRFIENFTGQWLELRKIDATLPDPKLYAEFDAFLSWSMLRETQLFFSEVLQHDHSVAEFIHSDWTMLNTRLAKHYGIEGVTEGPLRRTALPPGSHRGGLLTQASILKVTADGSKTSPILRGKWVLEKILGTPPAPPPPNIAAIEPDIRGATTIRQQLEKHQADASCAACHKHIDPPGFALESFDVIGGWREFYRSSDPQRSRGKVALENYPEREVLRGLDVEIGGTTAQGRRFQNVDEYKALLLEDREQIARNLVQQLLVYATGAEVQYADREEVAAIVKRTRGQNYGLRSLLHELTQSRLFLHK